tara:strand:+ start:50 stop:568 length:519 start_codon:yes stop_codon:yes gene_type:complete
MVIFLGFLYILIGLLTTTISLFFLELGRSKDILKGGLSLLIGVFLIFQRLILNSPITILLILNFLMVLTYWYEVMFNRWNDLTEKEKSRFSQLIQFFRSISDIFVNINKSFHKKFSEINSSKLLDQDFPTKKWVRKDDDRNQVYRVGSTNNFDANDNTANSPKKDIIDDEKN